MKHSAKLFTALAALALFAVVMAGIQDRSADAQSADGTTGRVYLTNKNSCLTTQPNPPASMKCGDSGRSYVGSGTALFGTVVLKDSESPHSELNTIAPDSDVVVVTVVDPDANTSRAGEITVNVNYLAGSITIVNIPTNRQPVTSTVSEIKLLVPGGDTSQPGAIVTQVGSNFIAIAGGSVGDDMLKSTRVKWEYSDVNSLDVDVYSLTDIDRDRVSLKLKETGASTGVFEGEIKLIANVVINGDDSAGSKGDASASPAVPAKLKVNAASRVTVKYEDAKDNSGDDDTVVRETAQVETTPPQAIISEPANDLNTQVRQPAFRGTVTDARSGLDVDSITLIIDQSDDPNNGRPVITGGVGDTMYSAPSGSEAYKPARAGNPGDGATSVAWSFLESGNMPQAVTAVQPDHDVDFVLVATDLAGNIGFSDADPTTAGVGVVVDNPDTKDKDEGTNEPHVITIDQKRPILINPDSTAHSGQTGSETGVAPDGEDAGTDPDLNNKRSIAVRFDDNVEGVENGDFQVTLNDGTALIPVGVQVDGNTVYLELDEDIPTGDTPVVRLQGAVSDRAGNTSSAGSVKAADRLSPALTVVLSGGSGSGAGKNGPTGLTRNEILVTITSDETLAGLPSVEVFVKDGDDADSDPDARGRLSVIAQGGNTWTARATRARLGGDGELSLLVTATDIAPASNLSTVGKKNPADATSGVTRFVLDSAKPTLVSKDSSTSQGRPSIRIEFNEVVDVSSATVGDIVLVDGDTNLLATSDKKLFFYVPSEDLELGELTVKATATDLAGNKAENLSYKLKVEERKTFDLSLFFGWNAVSVPSNPIDPDINAVFTNDSLAQVVAYDATDPGSPWRIASRDPVSGAWTSTTDTPLRTIMAGPGYWVHSKSFDAQNLALAGPIEPGSGQAPRVEAIPTGAGWNFVGVIDTTKGKTQGASGASLVRSDGTAITAEKYFASVDARRAFKYQATLQSFTEISLDGSATVKVGDGIWVFINAQSDGSTPAIAP